MHTKSRSGISSSESSRRDSAVSALDGPSSLHSSLQKQQQQQQYSLQRASSTDSVSSVSSVGSSGSSATGNTDTLPVSCGRGGGRRGSTLSSSSSSSEGLTASSLSGNQTLRKMSCAAIAFSRADSPPVDGPAQNRTPVQQYRRLSTKIRLAGEKGEGQQQQQQARERQGQGRQRTRRLSLVLAENGVNIGGSAAGQAGKSPEGGCSFSSARQPSPHDTTRGSAGESSAAGYSARPPRRSGFVMASDCGYEPGSSPSGLPPLPARESDSEESNEDEDDAFDSEISDNEVGLSRECT